jgi:hypothetical protein
MEGNSITCDINLPYDWRSIKHLPVFNWQCPIWCGSLLLLVPGWSVDLENLREWLFCCRVGPWGLVKLGLAWLCFATIIVLTSNFFTKRKYHSHKSKLCRKECGI